MRLLNNILLNEVEILVEVEPLVIPGRPRCSRLLIGLGRNVKPISGGLLGNEAVRDIWPGCLVVVDFPGIHLSLDQVEPETVTFLYLGCCECGVDISVACDGNQVIAAGDLVVLSSC